MGGVEQDYDKAAEQGDADAKRMLELMYDRPKGAELPVMG